MAEIHKVSVYVVDIHNRFSKLYIENTLKLIDMFTQQFHVETAEIGELEDDNPLNYPNCDLAELEKWFPKEPTKGINVRKIEVGAVYRHFKGHEVRVLAVAKDTENVSAYSVVYEHLGDGTIWSRPYDMFISEVDHEKYPEVKQKYRFEKVDGE